MHFQVKSTLKSNRNHTSTKHFIHIFAAHKPQPQFLPNSYLNLIVIKSRGAVSFYLFFSLQFFLKYTFNSNLKITKT
jgi:hypothetical protein